MRVYEATLIDKWSTPFEGEHSSYQGYVAVGTDEEIHKNPVELERTLGELTDEDVHYYFTEDEFKPVDGEIETEEFKYLIGRRIA